jgi:hypothetical protein
MQNYEIPKAPAAITSPKIKKLAQKAMKLPSMAVSEKQAEPWAAPGLCSTSARWPVASVTSMRSTC